MKSRELLRTEDQVNSKNAEIKKMSDQKNRHFKGSKNLQESQTLEGDECSTTEELSLEDEDCALEEAIQRSVQQWLDLHGTKLFNLEASKFIARETKRKNLRELR